MVEVLIIEDDDRIRPLLVKGLRECGHTVTSAPTGMTGLQLAVDSSPDLVVLDLGLPGIDGFETLSGLKAEGYRGSILVVTAHASMENRLRALNAGADDFLEIGRAHV